MPIKEINNNGKSKIVSRSVGVLQSPRNGHSGNKANQSAPSHVRIPIKNLGHASNPTRGMKGSY